MNEHTPGPLTVHGPSLGGTPCDDGGDYAIYDSEGFIIAEAICKVGRAQTPGRYITRPAKANATLWAAAPELYGATKAASEYYEMLEQATGVEHPVLKQLRAALALIDKETT